VRGRVRERDCLQRIDHDVHDDPCLLAESDQGILVKIKVLRGKSECEVLASFAKKKNDVPREALTLVESGLLPDVFVVDVGRDREEEVRVSCDREARRRRPRARSTA